MFFLWAQQENSDGFRQGQIIGMLFCGVLAGLVVAKYGQNKGHTKVAWVFGVLTTLAGTLAGSAAGLIGAGLVAVIGIVILNFWPVKTLEKSRPRRSTASNPFPTRVPDQPYDL